MHRLTAVLLGLALAWTSGQAAALHVHAYADHEHPEHVHGLAAHGHQGAELPGDGERLEPCDPGAHAVPITMGCAPPRDAPLATIGSDWPGLVSPRAPVRAADAPADVRAHGPPGSTEAPPRAPPLTSRI